MKQSTAPARHGNMCVSRGYFAVRPAVLSVAHLLFGVMNLPLLRAAPTFFAPLMINIKEDASLPPHSPRLWIYLSFAVGLVLLGGAFAGLTIALMGQVMPSVPQIPTTVLNVAQDEIYLQVIEKSGEGNEKRHAARVLRLLKRGKHWVLVTLLLGNVITNETLPIVLDRSLGGGWPAVLGSTALIGACRGHKPQRMAHANSLQSSLAKSSLNLFAFVTVCRLGLGCPL